MDIWKSPWTYLVLILIVIGLFFVYKNITGNVVKSGEYDEFAKYLTEQGVKMYGTEWCPHCKNQKKLFGSSFQYIDYIDCDKNSQECSNARVTGYPTWKINNKNYPGEQSLERLDQLSGYNQTI
ncbi:MAG: thioredoxin domain-containing protein [Nanoarchaeota archaeon]